MRIISFRFNYTYLFINVCNKYAVHRKVIADLTIKLNTRYNRICIYSVHTSINPIIEN